MQSEGDRFLRILADAAAQEPAWSAFAQFCRDREAGLRENSFAHLTAFIAQALTWSAPERRRFVGWICEHCEQYPDNYHKALPHPLVEQIMAPTLKSSIETDPEDSRPHRWLGMFFREHLRADWPVDTEDPVYRHLRAAVAKDAGEQPARIVLVEFLLERLQRGADDLPEMFMAPAVASELIGEARALIEGVADDEVRSGLATVLGYYEQITIDWTEFQVSGGADFAEWCRVHGRDYKWSRRYYFPG